MRSVAGRRCLGTVGPQHPELAQGYCAVTLKPRLQGLLVFLPHMGPGKMGPRSHSLITTARQAGQWGGGQDGRQVAEWLVGFAGHRGPGGGEGESRPHTVVVEKVMAKRIDTGTARELDAVNEAVLTATRAQPPARISPERLRPAIRRLLREDYCDDEIATGVQAAGLVVDETELRRAIARERAARATRREKRAAQRADAGAAEEAKGSASVPSVRDRRPPTTEETAGRVARAKAPDTQAI